MKIKIHPTIRPLVSKHFVQRLLKITLPLQVSQHEFKQYWETCSTPLKRNSLCFFSKELIDLVNKTNNRLLYSDIIAKKQSLVDQSSSASKDYSLLNAFEMLWNIDSGSSGSANSTDDGNIQHFEQTAATPKETTDNMDLVQILSHPDENTAPTETKQAFETSKVQGHALTIKEEFLNSLLDICSQINPQFLECSSDSILICQQTNEKLVISDEDLLFKSINANKINSWESFELLLSFIIENRLLQLYQAFLDSEFQHKQKKLDSELIAYQDTSAGKQCQNMNLKHKNKKKKQKKNKNKRVSKLAEETQVYNSFLVHLDSIIKIQRAFRRHKQHIKSVNSPTLQFSDKKRCRSNSFRHMFPIKFKRDDFQLDFSQTTSDRSTIDYVYSDEDFSKNTSQEKSKQAQGKVEMSQQQSRQSQQTNKFYWHLPQPTQRESIKKHWKELDDISSESSDDSSEENDLLESYMQECYYQTYLKFEQAALKGSHIVDTYNYNPKNQWQNTYLQNQQLFQMQEMFQLSLQNQNFLPRWDCNYYQEFPAHAYNAYFRQ